MSKGRDRSNTSREVEALDKILSIEFKDVDDSRVYSAGEIAEQMKPRKEGEKAKSYFDDFEAKYLPLKSQYIDDVAEAKRKIFAESCEGREAAEIKDADEVTLGKANQLIEAKDTEIATLKQERDTYKTERDDARNKLDEANAEVTRLKGVVEAAGTTTKASQDDENKPTWKTKWKTAIEERDEANTNVAKLQGQLGVANARADSETARADGLQQQITNMIAQGFGASGVSADQLAGLQSQITAKNDEITRLNGVIKQYEQQPAPAPASKPVEKVDVMDPIELLKAKPTVQFGMTSKGEKTRYVLTYKDKMINIGLKPLLEALGEKTVWKPCGITPDGIVKIEDEAE